MTTNLFTEGLNTDTNPMAVSNQQLTYALNGTVITMNGNEAVLQNDQGNVNIDTAYLPSGYIPVGVKSYGGIIYVASLNPTTGKCQVGSFPSPQTRFSTDTENWKEPNTFTLLDCGIQISEFDENKEIKDQPGAGLIISDEFYIKDILGDKFLRVGDRFNVFSDIIKNLNSEAQETFKDLFTKNYHQSIQIRSILSKPSISQISIGENINIKPSKYQNIQITKPDLQRVVTLNKDVIYKAKASPVISSTSAQIRDVDIPLEATLINNQIQFIGESKHLPITVELQYKTENSGIPIDFKNTVQESEDIKIKVPQEWYYNSYNELLQGWQKADSEWKSLEGFLLSASTQNSEFNKDSLLTIRYGDDSEINFEKAQLRLHGIINGTQSLNWDVYGVYNSEQDFIYIYYDPFSGNIYTNYKEMYLYRVELPRNYAIVSISPNIKHIVDDNWFDKLIYIQSDQERQTLTNKTNNSNKFEKTTDGEFVSKNNEFESILGISKQFNVLTATAYRDENGEIVENTFEVEINSDWIDLSIIDSYIINSLSLESPNIYLNWGLDFNDPLQNKTIVFGGNFLTYTEFLEKTFNKHAYTYYDMHGTNLFNYYATSKCKGGYSNLDAFSYPNNDLDINKDREAASIISRHMYNSSSAVDSKVFRRLYYWNGKEYNPGVTMIPIYYHKKDISHQSAVTLQASELFGSNFGIRSYQYFYDDTRMLIDLSFNIHLEEKETLDEAYIEVYTNLLNEPIVPRINLHAVEYNDLKDIPHTAKVVSFNTVSIDFVGDFQKDRVYALKVVGIRSENGKFEENCILLTNPIFNNLNSKYSNYTDIDITELLKPSIELHTDKLPGEENAEDNITTLTNTINFSHTISFQKPEANTDIPRQVNQVNACQRASVKITNSLDSNYEGFSVVQDNNVSLNVNSIDITPNLAEEQLFGKNLNNTTYNIYSSEDDTNVPYFVDNNIEQSIPLGLSKITSATLQNENEGTCQIDFSFGFERISEGWSNIPKYIDSDLHQGTNVIENAFTNSKSYAGGYYNHMLKGWRSYSAIQSFGDVPKGGTYFLFPGLFRSFTRTEPSEKEYYLYAMKKEPGHDYSPETSYDDIKQYLMSQVEYNIIPYGKLNGSTYGMDTIEKKSRFQFSVLRKQSVNSWQYSDIFKNYVSPNSDVYISQNIGKSYVINQYYYPLEGISLNSTYNVDINYRISYNKNPKITLGGEEFSQEAYLSFTGVKGYYTNLPSAATDTQNVYVSKSILVDTNNISNTEGGVSEFNNTILQGTYLNVCDENGNYIKTLYLDNKTRKGGTVWRKLQNNSISEISKEEMDALEIDSYESVYMYDTPITDQMYESQVCRNPIYNYILKLKTSYKINTDNDDSDIIYFVSSKQLEGQEFRTRAELDKYFENNTISLRYASPVDLQQYYCNFPNQEHLKDYPGNESIEIINEYS